MLMRPITDYWRFEVRVARHGSKVNLRAQENHLSTPGAEFEFTFLESTCPSIRGEISLHGEPEKVFWTGLRTLNTHPHSFFLKPKGSASPCWQLLRREVGHNITESSRRRSRYEVKPFVRWSCHRTTNEADTLRICDRKFDYSTLLEASLILTSLSC